MFLLLLVSSIYLMLPGIFANFAPVLVKNHFKKLARPIDNNKQFMGAELFGKNKTWRGFLFAIVFSIVVVWLQKELYVFLWFQNISIINYSEHSVLLLGFLMGFGVMIGDLIESFFKRRLGIKPGERFFPWDQLDSLIGGLLFVSIVFIPPLRVVITLIILSLVFHVGIRHIAYYLGINKTKW